MPPVCLRQSLEQERHLLRRRLEEVKGESEARVLELQADVETLRSQLEEQNERSRRAERDQATLVTELTAQNARLADQLREAAKQEEQLLIEVKVLREKCALRSTTLQDHVSSLEVLRDEVNEQFPATAPAQTLSLSKSRSRNLLLASLAAPYATFPVFGGFTAGGGRFASKDRPSFSLVRS